MFQERLPDGDVFFMSPLLNWERKLMMIGRSAQVRLHQRVRRLSSSSGGCSTSLATHVVVLCNLSWVENVIYSVRQALMLFLMCNEYEGSGELELLFSLGVPA